MIQFNPSQCRSMPTVGIVGGTVEEKKRIIQHILSANDLYNGIVVQAHDPDTLATFVENQYKLVRKDRTIGSRRFCIIEEATESKEFVDLVQHTSFLRTSVFLPFNDIVSMPPHIRNNIDCIFVSKSIDTRLKNKVHKAFGSIFNRFCAFDLALTQCKSWMVLYFGNPSNKMEDNVYHYDLVGTNFP